MHLLLFISHLLPIFRPSPYQQAFGQTYNTAVQLLQESRPAFEEISETCNCDVNTISAIMFPEMLRFNDLSNLIETSALEILYAEGGIGAMDYSIGPAQIKPSFAERMEQVNQNRKLLPSFSNNGISERRARLTRLEDIQWQFRYVCAFNHYMMARFPELNQLPDNNRVRFIAAAYNLGPDASKTDILAWQHVNAFPYGSKYIGTQYNFAAIAADYFSRTLNQQP